MKYEYKTIPTHPTFEICDTAPMEFAVRSVKTKEYLNVHITFYGYPRVFLKKKLGGDGKHYFLHRLIAETYIGDIPDGMVIDHLDTNKLNFSHNNLKICTSKENSNNPLTRKLNSECQKIYWTEKNRKKHSILLTQQFINNSHLKEKFSNLHNSEKKGVQQIDKITGKIIKEYFGLHDAERKTNINHNRISRVCRGLEKTAGGFLWQFK